jgi:16S rRNA (cytosine1402-N4)-methyltransferase
MTMVTQGVLEWEGVHQSVMPKEVIDCLRCHRSGIYVDGTCGLGGHSEGILEASSPDGRLLALDRDQEAMEIAKNRLQRFGSRVRFIHDNFCNLPLVLNRLGIAAVDGILLDIGLSSYQLSHPHRGFSFQEDGPLDMRMDKTQGTTARDLINHLDEKELANLIWKFGEERASRRIAHAIVVNRQTAPIGTTQQLVEIIRRAVGGSAFRRSQRIHFATKTFQALRIAVNEELENLQSFLLSAPACLQPSGRLVVIAFHSLEDRLVKNFFRRLCGYGSEEEQIHGDMFPVTRDIPQAAFRAVTRKAMKAGEEETDKNPRSRSARLRCVEKISEDV